MNIQATDATLGATVRDVDLARIDDRDFRAIRDAWHEFAVLVFEDQHLDDAGHIAFSRRLGPLERLHSAALTDENPLIFRSSNVRPDGSIDRPGGFYEIYNRGNLLWHTDSSYKRVPAKASILRAVRTTTQGGETEFADMRAAYEALDDERRSWLDAKLAVHDWTYSQGQIGGLEIMTDAEKAAIPAVRHPVVRIHPDTGRKALYIGRHASHIVGEDVKSSRALLAQLADDACQAPRVYVHHWREGEVVMWDNRCVLHRRRPSPPEEPRIMLRTTVAGDAEDNEWVCD